MDAAATSPVAGAHAPARSSVDDSARNHHSRAATGERAAGRPQAGQRADCIAKLGALSELVGVKSRHSSTPPGSGTNRKNFARGGSADPKDPKEPAITFHFPY